MELYNIGTAVHVGPDASVEGTIVSIIISTNNHVQYKVSYWSNGQRYETWMECGEIKVPSALKPDLKIGFGHHLTRR